ncbi:CshA/CshB family fibrillar adhesin-related protein [Chitinophaga defluvii]|uniref:CshA/CshB family fibrillar adhesin-related protein n=1 Tax=Chitinophaga defluvii TaxID=3163343 RepID=A0ABV2SZW0_9BACT
MRKLILVLSLLLLATTSTYGQYANDGTGVLRDQIWWFDWNGFVLADGASRTFTTADGLVVIITFSKVSGSIPEPSPMTTWTGAVLHFLYNFTDPSIYPALYTNGNSTNAYFTLTVTATRAGVPSPYTFVAADAEGSSLGEKTTLKTNGSNWTTLEFFRNSGQTSNPLTGCGTQTLTIEETHGGAVIGEGKGQNPIMATNALANTPLIIDVTLDKNNIRGGMAMTFGIFAPIDRGDLPADYGFAQHQINYDNINGCNYLPPMPAIIQSQALKMGALPGDADGQETTDDNANGADEDGVLSFTEYDGSGTYSVDVAVTNTTGSNAFLTGWFDFNGDKTFNTGESVTVTVPPDASQATLSWTGLPATLPAGSSIINYFGFRFRLSSDLLSTQRATGFAKDGEVEDYLVPFTIPCNYTITTNSNTPVCEGTSLQLNTTGGGVKHTWSPATGLSDPSIANPVATPATTTTYTVTGYDTRGCLSEATVEITVLPLPVITKSQDASICQSQDIRLSATAPDAASYTWTPSEGLSAPDVNNPLAAPQTTTRYTVKVSGRNGCSSEEVVNVTVTPSPSFDIKAATPIICKGEKALLSASGGDTYSWYTDNNTPFATAADVEVQPAVSTTYKVLITDNTCNVNKEMQVPVMVNNLPVTTVSSTNLIDCSHNKTQLIATGGSAYQWEPAPGITQLSSPAIWATPLQTTTYYVNITDNNKCTVRDSVKVEVDLNTALSNYPIPNAFSPNNDGKNDCFGLKYWGPVIELEFAIFNRWGENVFRTKNPTACWDGTYKGVPQPVGTYVYYISAKTICGTAFRKGALSLIR